ncbi:MAG: DUF3592 domain-containing protein [Gammaproteobacteria bacterium]
MKYKIIMFVVAGILLLGYGGYTLSQQWHFYRHGVITSGVVTGISKQRVSGVEKIISLPSHQSEYRYYPIVTFDTEYNQQITFVEHASVNKPDYYPLGSQVNVIYLLDSPQTAEISNKIKDLLLPMLAVIIGLFSLILAKSTANRHKLQQLLNKREQRLK